MTIHKVNNKGGKILRSGLSDGKSIILPSTEIIQSPQTSKLKKALGRNVAPVEASGDPYAANVVLLTYANKTGTSYTDQTGKTITLFGSGTTSGFGLIYFPADSSNYGQLAANQSDFWFGNGDWTIEFLVSSSSWTNNSSIVGAHLLAQRNLSDQFGFTCFFYDGNISFLDSGFTNSYDFAWTPSNNTGYLIAIHRDGSNIRCAVNGSQIGSTQSWVGGSLINSTAPTRFGGDSFNNHGLINFHGIRITKGIARDIFTLDSLPWDY